MSEKLQKVLARAGLGSRREIERWIADGRIQINNRVAQLGDRITGQEYIQLDAKPLALNESQAQTIRVIAYHKSIGSVCSRQDQQGRPTVFDDFPKLKNGRWILVGRLDLNTTGLLLATTDGELANRLMHPKYQVKREYAVRIYGDVNDAMLHRLQRGVELDDGIARFDNITLQGGEGRNHWFTVDIHEGRNREVRRLWESQGVQVNRLARNSFGPIQIPRRLRRGEYQELTQGQVDHLCRLVQLLPSSEATNKESRKKLSTSAKPKRKIRELPVASSRKKTLKRKKGASTRTR